MPRQSENTHFKGTVRADAFVPSSFDTAGNVHVEGTLLVDDAATLSDALDVAGNATVGGDLTVTGNASAVDVSASGNIDCVDLAASGDATVGTVTVGASAQALSLLKTASVAVNPAEIAAGATGDTAVTVSGAAAGDVVIANIPALLEAGLVFGGAWVSDTDEVTIRLGNVTGSPVNGASLSWSLTLMRLA